MKLIRIVGLGTCFALVVGGVVLIASTAFALTRPVVDASEQFLSAIAEGKLDQAYASVSEGLRARLDNDDFASAVQQLALAEYASASWQNRVIENSTGLTEGTVATKTGGSRPIRIRLVWENDAWKVHGVTYGGTNLLENTLPSQREIERLVSQSLLGLNDAVQTKDFAAFYDSLSDIWKKQTTPTALQASFQEFIDKKINFAIIKNQKPLIAPAKTLTSDGSLQLKGQYPIEPTPVHFELGFASENGEWKLLSISVHVGKFVEL